MKKSERGLFITLEGGEGAGKSTLIRKLSQALSEQGRSVVVTREPGGTRLGEHIRGMLLDNGFKNAVDRKAELLLFLAARAQHIQELILPSLSEGKVVLCDRFNDSTIAYQGVARGLGLEYTRRLCQDASELVPDLTFILDIDPTIGLQRTKSLSKEHAAAGEVDRIESEALEFHQKIREAFHLLAKQEPKRIHLIDSNQSEEAVFIQAMELVHKFI